MGQGYSYDCPACGHSAELCMGIYNCKGWGDRPTLRDIEDGRYGKDAKSALAKHPKSLYHFQSDVFVCGCGYTKSYDSLVIHSNDYRDWEVFYSTRHRCPRCKRTMRSIAYFPTSIRCHRCGAESPINRRSMVRWNRCWMLFADRVSGTALQNFMYCKYIVLSSDPWSRGYDVALTLRRSPVQIRPGPPSLLIPCDLSIVTILAFACIIPSVWTRDRHATYAPSQTSVLVQV